MDDLASALVDGQLDADEANAARRRPDVVARAAELEAGRAALRDVPAPDPVARERALAAALAAFDEAAPAASGPPPPRSDSIGGDGAGSGAGPAPVDLAAHRQHRARQGPGVSAGRGGPRWLGAAAAVVAVLMGLAGLAALSSRSGQNDNADTAAEVGVTQDDGGDATASAEDSADQPSAAPESGGDEGSGERARPVEAGDLGTFPSGDALVDHLTARVPDAGTGAEIVPDATAPLDADQEASGGFGACGGAPLPPPLDDPAEHRLHGTAVVDGREVDVWVVDTVQGRRAVAIDTACAVVVDRPLS